MLAAAVRQDAEGFICINSHLEAQLRDNVKQLLPGKAFGICFSAGKTLFRVV